MMSETKSRVPPMIKVALVLTLLGYVNALIALGITWHLNTQQPMDRCALQLWSRIVVWIWPSGIMMMALHSDSYTIAVTIGAAISVLANACFYGTVGLA
jgi:hypothetical protein